eukprot:Gb_09806 [translate_table: standard]
MEIVRHKSFSYIDRELNFNILEGIELHENIFGDFSQKMMLDVIFELQEKGEKGLLRECTFLKPKTWMQGKGRKTLQFGCCFNYRSICNNFKYGNHIGISQVDEVDHIPNLFIKVTKRLIRWHVLPTDCVPDNCIINIYEVGDCIPPHIDHHNFL